MNLSYNKIHNYIWYQSIWCIAVFGGAGYEWLLAALIGLHLLLCKLWKAEAIIMFACAAIGLAIDTFFTISGVFVFKSAPELLPVPLWLAAIWLGFSGTFRHSLHFMLQRPVLMTLAAGIFAPLSYHAAMRFGAVQFPMGNLTTFALVSVSWMSMVSVFIRLSRFLDSKQDSDSPVVPEQAATNGPAPAGAASDQLVFENQSTTY